MYPKSKGKKPSLARTISSLNGYPNLVLNSKQIWEQLGWVQGDRVYISIRPNQLIIEKYITDRERNISNDKTNN